MSKEAMKLAIITEAEIQMNDHPSKDARWFAKSVYEYLLAEQPAQQDPVQRYSPDGEGGMEVDSLGAWMKFTSQPASKPLTEYQKWRMYETGPDIPSTAAGIYMRAVDDTEAAHGITGEQK